MDIIRSQASYKCFGIEGSKAFHFNFYSYASNSSVYPSSNGKHSYPFVFDEDGEVFTEKFSQTSAKKSGTTY